MGPYTRALIADETGPLYGAIKQMSKKIPKPVKDDEALAACIVATRDTENRVVAKQLSAKMFDAFSVRSTSDAVVHRALGSVLCKPTKSPTIQVSASPSTLRRFDTLAKAWLACAAGEDPRSLLKGAPKARQERGGAIEWLTLDLWERAIIALGDGDEVSARRFFERAVDFATNCESESAVAIQWSFVGSFFHRNL
jgi:hypothetical protein